MPWMAPGRSGIDRGVDLRSLNLKGVDRSDRGVSSLSVNTSLGSTRTVTMDFRKLIKYLNGKHIPFRRKSFEFYSLVLYISDDA